SAGGQGYDRTTGTWVGENQGSVGDGVDRSAEAGRVKIWHGTDGPVGVQVAKTTAPTPGGVARPQVTTGKGGGGAGPGSPAAGGNGGTGPGSAAVVAEPLKPKLKPTHAQIMVGGGLVPHDAGWSDASEAEDRWGESEFLSP